MESQPPGRAPRIGHHRAGAAHPGADQAADGCIRARRCPPSRRRLATRARPCASGQLATRPRLGWCRRSMRSVATAGRTLPERILPCRCRCSSTRAATRSASTTRPGSTTWSTAVNAGVLSSLFGAVISTHMKSRRDATLATIAFGVVGELGWEAMEYLGQAIGFQGMALSEDDTLGDIGSALVGTAFAAAITWTRWRPAEEAPLADWGEKSPSELGRAEVSPTDQGQGSAESRAGRAPRGDRRRQPLPAPPGGSVDGPRAPRRDS